MNAAGASWRAHARALGLARPTTGGSGRVCCAARAKGAAQQPNEGLESVRRLSQPAASLPDDLRRRRRRRQHLSLMSGHSGNSRVSPAPPAAAELRGPPSGRAVLSSPPSRSSAAASLAAMLVVSCWPVVQHLAGSSCCCRCCRCVKWRGARTALVTDDPALRPARQIEPAETN